MTTEIKSLGTALPIELSRCRELLNEYKSVGAPGVFAAHNLEELLKATDKAMIEGDTVAMIKCYGELKNSC